MPATNATASIAKKRKAPARTCCAGRFARMVQPLVENPTTRPNQTTGCGQRRQIRSGSPTNQSSTSAARRIGRLHGFTPEELLQWRSAAPHLGIFGAEAEPDQPVAIGERPHQDARALQRIV